MANNKAVQKVVLSGMKLLYSPSTAKLLDDGLKADVPMPQKLAIEIAGIMKLVDERTPKGIPPEAIAPGAVMLLLDLAHFMRQSGAGNPTDEDIQAAIKILQKFLLEIFTKMGKGVQGAAQPQQPQQPQPAQQPQQQPPRGLLAQQGA
jgi:hypothetical protein